MHTRKTMKFKEIMDMTICFLTEFLADRKADGETTISEQDIKVVLQCSPGRRVGLGPMVLERIRREGHLIDRYVWTGKGYGHVELIPDEKSSRNGEEGEWSDRPPLDTRSTT